MDTDTNETASSFIGATFVSFMALFLLIGCSTTPAAKPQEATAPQRVEAAQRPSRAAPSKAAPSKPSQVSSLEAHRKGTLGKGTGMGPLRDVNFDFDRYDIRPDAREILKKHTAWLKANPSVRVEIEGHADERGTNEYNLALGAKRADSVKRYLVDSGIASGRFSTVSYGEELPVCKEQNEICWAKNRRGHFAIKTTPTN